MERIVPASVYQQYNADYSLPFPGQGYGGWKKTDIPIDPEHTAMIVMHAWDCGTLQTSPATHRVCEYLPRSQKILSEQFPGFLEAVRKSDLRLIHVGSKTEKSLPTLRGYIRTEKLNVHESVYEQIPQDETAKKLHRLHTEQVLYGDNAAEVRRESTKRDFAIMPLEHEDVVCTSDQLFALCKRDRITHLIYSGFCINACLTLSPCGWVDMMRHGLICSVIRDLTTAVENKESCAEERNKAYGLWAFSLWGGFVFDREDIEAKLLRKA